MPKIVRIADGEVVEIFEAMPVFHPSLMQQIRDDAPDDATFGWSFDGTSYAPPPPPPPTEQDYVMAVQNMLDAKAQERNYDNIASACTYDGDPDPIFSAEGAACKAWRSAVWRRCYEDLAKVQSGEMAQPTIEEFLASLPTLTWP